LRVQEIEDAGRHSWLPGGPSLYSKIGVQLTGGDVSMNAVRVEDLGQHSDAVDDSRAGPAEVDRIEDEDLAAPDCLEVGQKVGLLQPR
jgi:hypothetical protein